MAIRTRTIMNLAAEKEHTVLELPMEPIVPSDGQGQQNDGFEMSMDKNKSDSAISVDVPPESAGGGEGEPNIRRDRPHSASMMSRRTTTSTTSRASLSPSIIMTDYTSRNMFSYREGALDQAVKQCKKSFIGEETDGEVKQWWLLTEIDHWDLEKERLVILTDKSLLIIKYDFINASPLSVRKIELNNIEKLVIGDIVYPSSSFMASRDHGGLRIFLSNEESGFFQRWNPWCQSLPYVTLTHHLLIYNKNEYDTASFNVEDLSESLLGAVNALTTPGSERKRLELQEGQLLVETYASVTSMIYNQSKLGFNLDRNGVNF